MTDLITGVEPMVTKIFTDWLPGVASFIVGTPIVLATTAFLFIGGCVGLFGRMLSKR